MENKHRCNCAITCSLDVLGDKWMLVIVKQMLIEGKKTFKDFIESDEAIATNILATKLKLLNKLGIVTKSKFLTNRKSFYYHLTEKGLSLTPIIVELAIWGDENLRESNPNIISRSEEFMQMKSDKVEFTKILIENYKNMQTETINAIS